MRLGHPRAEGTSTMSDTSDPLEILNAIDRERGESFIGMIQANQVQRLRDEIVALRKMTDGDWVWQQITSTRDAALEEAAHECDEEAKGSSEGFRNGCETCAAAIRALKDKPCLGG